MLLTRLYKKADFMPWLTSGQPAELPKQLGRLILFFINMMPVRFYSLLFFSCVNAAAALAVPYATKVIVDAMTVYSSNAGNRWDYIAGSFALLLVFILGRLFFSYCIWLQSYQWRAQAFGKINNIILSYVQQHEHSFFENDFAGRIIQKSAALGKSTSGILNTILWNAGPAVFYFFTGLIMLGFISPFLCLFGVIWFFTVLGLANKIGQEIRTSAKQFNESLSQVTGHFADCISNIRAVIHFAQQQEEGITLAEKQNAAMNSDRYWYLTILNVRILNHIMGVIGVLGLVGGAVYLWTLDMASIGDIAMTISLVMLIMGRVQDLAENLPDILDQIGVAEDSLQTLVKPHKIIDAPHAPALQVTHGEITLENITYHYTPGTNVFEDFTLTIKPGERIGLVGTSGAGKTTLVHLLLRLYDVQQGSIMIDRQNIKHVTQSSLRRNIAFIPQDIVLFHRSIRDNIAYGRPDATLAEVEAAARAAQAHDFISQLPQGYNTLVGERGVRLSGGQRQRVAIARALLKNAPILILDEATSALDSEAEAEIQVAIKLAMTNKTVIAIAHRLSTISSLDRLIVLEDGKISEQGTHAELLTKNGLYARLWARQSGGFLGLE